MGREVKRKVQGIVDGDTFRVQRRVNGSQYIRVAGKNAPERGERGYESAKRELARQIGGSTVTIRSVGRSYGRTVAEVPAVKRIKKKKK